MDKEKELARVGIFEKLDRRHLRNLASICVEKNFDSGALLVKQGENGVGLFIILSGRVRISKIGADKSETFIAESGPGDILGEMSVFDGAPRSANALALEPTRCLVLASWEFNAFLKSNPEAMHEFLHIVVARYRQTNEALLGLRSARHD